MPQLLSGTRDRDDAGQGDSDACLLLARQAFAEDRVREDDGDDRIERAEHRHECEQAIGALLPMLGRPLHKALGSLVSGVVLAESVRLSRASAASPGLAKDRSKQRRAQRVLANARFDVAACRPALMRRILEHRVGRLDVLLDDAELARRSASWAPPPPRHVAGLLAKYAQCVGQADAGAVTHRGGVVWPNSAVIPDSPKG